MAWYPAATRKPIAPGPTDPKIKPRVVILHVDAGNAESLYGWFNGPSGGVESHFFVKKTGEVEQYRDTSIQADANTDANDFAISIETQGFAAGEWTPAQLASIKALILWCHTTHGIPLVKVKTWDGSGIGYHTLFPGSWDKRGASCPGPDRIKQFNNVLVPWMATGEEDDMAMTPEERAAFIGDIADEVLKRPVRDIAGNEVTVGAALGYTLRNSQLIAQLEKASVEQIADATVAKLGGGASAHDIAAEIITQLIQKETP